MKKVAVCLIVLIALAGCSQNSKEPGSKPKSSSSTSQPQAPQPETHPVPMPITPRPVEPIAAEVLESYSGVVLTITERSSGKVTEVEVPFNTATAVDGTTLTVEVTQFYPDFIMSEKGYASRSLDADNVAARVKVTGGALEFDGILFKEYPEIHTYDGPDYAIALTEAVAK